MSLSRNKTALPSTNSKEAAKIKSQEPIKSLQIRKRVRVAYIMSRFPKITETFILQEMLAMERLGIEVEVFPLLRERTDKIHPEALKYIEIAHYEPFISLSILRINLSYFFQKPRKYLGTLWDLLRANWGSFRFFTGAIGIFPKSVYFAHLMKKEKIDHIHAHFASHPAASGYIIHRLEDIPYSFVAHGSDLHRDRHMICEKVSAASFVVSISQFNRDIIVEECKGEFKDKVFVIHCGVDTITFRPNFEKKATEENEKTLKIICIGTLHEVKGQTHLIAACKLLAERGVEFTCQFVGDGPDLEFLEWQTLEAGLTNIIEFRGSLTRQEVIEIFQSVDVLVAPSVPSSDGRREGIPVVLMEAMASGLPVVASEISGIPELVNDGINGLLTPPGDSTAIADALEGLRNDPQFSQSLGEAGREKIVREFDVYKNAEILVGHMKKKLI